MPRSDVAIYMPHAAGVYRSSTRRTGGAERQTVMLGRALVTAGLRVSFVVFPVDEEVAHPSEPRLVERPWPRHGRLGRAIEPLIVWEAMARADASVYVFRSASAVVGVAAAFCRARNRKLVFSSASNADFGDKGIGMDKARADMFAYGARNAAAIVVQSQEQVGLAHRRFPGSRVVQVPSFVEPMPAARGEPDAFLWVGRIVDYKRPLQYVELARAMPHARFRMIAVPAVGDTTPEFEAELVRTAAGVPNLEVLRPVAHAALMELLGHTVAVVNTSEFEGMPNVWLEGWARGVPALSLDFDPDGRIGRERLGIAASGDWDTFLAGACELWDRREDRGGFAEATRRYVAAVHGPDAVGASWTALLRELL